MSNTQWARISAVDLPALAAGDGLPDGVKWSDHFLGAPRPRSILHGESGRGPGIRGPRSIPDECGMPKRIVPKRVSW